MHYNMKHFILAIVLIPLFTLVSAQDANENYDYLDQNYDSTVYKKESSIKPLKKVHVGADVNMAYTFSSNDLMVDKCLCFHLMLVIP